MFLMYHKKAVIFLKQQDHRSPHVPKDYLLHLTRISVKHVSIFNCFYKKRCHKGWGWRRDGVTLQWRCLGDVTVYVIPEYRKTNTVSSMLVERKAEAHKFTCKIVTHTQKGNNKKKTKRKTELT